MSFFTSGQLNRDWPSKYRHEHEWDEYGLCGQCGLPEPDFEPSDNQLPLLASVTDDDTSTAYPWNNSDGTPPNAN